MEGTSIMVLRKKQDEDFWSEEERKDKSIVGGRWNKQEDRNREDS